MVALVALIKEQSTGHCSVGSLHFCFVGSHHPRTNWQAARSELPAGHPSVYTQCTGSTNNSTATIAFDPIRVFAPCPESIHDPMDTPHICTCQTYRPVLIFTVHSNSWFSPPVSCLYASVVNGSFTLPDARAAARAEVALRTPPTTRARTWPREDPNEEKRAK